MTTTILLAAVLRFTADHYTEVNSETAACQAYIGLGTALIIPVFGELSATPMEQLESKSVD